MANEILNHEQILELASDYKPWQEVEEASLDHILDRYIAYAKGLPKKFPVMRFQVVSTGDYLESMQASQGIEGIGVIFHEKRELLYFKNKGYFNTPDFLDDEITEAREKHLDEAHVDALLKEHQLYQHLCRKIMGVDLPLALFVYTNPQVESIRNVEKIEDEFERFDQMQAQRLKKEQIGANHIELVFNFWERCGYRHKHREELTEKILSLH